MSTPELTAEQVAELPRKYRDVVPESVPYGAPLHQMVCEFTYGRNWLEGAIRAGHVPDAEGLELAYEGLFSYTRGQVTENVRNGHYDSASEVLGNATMYREQARRLVEEAESLDAWHALLVRREGGGS